MHLRFYATAGASVVASVLALSGLVNPGIANAAAGPSAAVAPSSVAPAAVTPSGTLPGKAEAASLPPGTAQECPPPSSLLQEQCQLFVRRAAQPNGSASSDAVPPPLSPSDLRAAYGLTAASANDGKGETVAIVDAYKDPYIKSDYTTFRDDMGILPPCYPTSPAGCLTVMNQWGNTDPSRLPKHTNAGWENETALDVEMVAAICPNCHIDLFEANSDNLSALGTAENSAAKKADFISNSWSGLDFPGESYYDTMYFNHPGVAIAFASGDYRYGASYPASSQLVTSVGGTYLRKNSSGAWVQSVWSGQKTGTGTGTGGGCSSGEPKPAWQSDPGCANRTQNDVAAVASAPNGVAFYSTPIASTCGGGLCEAYGTSVAAPIIAATYALAGVPTPATYPASYPYRNPVDLTHVTSGANGACEPNRHYLCNASDSLSDGYNGPTGLGTPNGAHLTAFAPPNGDVISVINPGIYDLQVGLGYHLPAINAYDRAGPGATFRYKLNRGMPKGLVMNHSTGAISGRVSSPVNRVYRLTVTNGTVSTTVRFRIVAVKSMVSAYHATVGEVHLDLGGMCMNDNRNSSANGTKVSVWKCNGNASEKWLYRPSSEPGGAGTIRIHHKCLNVEGTKNGSKLILYRCNGHPSQFWQIIGAAGELYNPVSGECLNDPGGSTRNGRQLSIWPCNGTARQAWRLPASPVTSGVPGKCLDDAGNSSANGTHIVSWKCDGSARQRFSVALNGTLRIHGKCLNVIGQHTLDGSVVDLQTCTGNLPAEYWLLAANGMIENLYSGKCLAIPRNSANNGKWVRLEDCYGLPGEIWAVS